VAFSPGTGGSHIPVILATQEADQEDQGSKPALEKIVQEIFSQKNHNGLEWLKV
jgi:hypothetical protein